MDSYSDNIVCFGCIQAEFVVGRSCVRKCDAIRYFYFTLSKACRASNGYFWEKKLLIRLLFLGRETFSVSVQYIVKLLHLLYIMHFI